jgi:hypothetical protein
MAFDYVAVFGLCFSTRRTASESKVLEGNRQRCLLQVLQSYPRLFLLDSLGAILLDALSFAEEDTSWRGKPPKPSIY